MRKWFINIFCIVHVEVVFKSGYIYSFYCNDLTIMRTRENRLTEFSTDAARHNRPYLDLQEVVLITTSLTWRWAGWL